MRIESAAHDPFPADIAWGSRDFTYAVAAEMVSSISVPAFEPASDRQLSSREFGAFVDAGQAMVPSTPACTQDCRIDTLPVIHDLNPELAFVVTNSYLDSFRVRVPERVAQ